MIGAHMLTIRAGISYRQCDYWTRTGLLTAVGEDTPGTGHVRTYADEQATRAATIKALLDAGLSLQAIRVRIDEFLTAGQMDIGPFTLAVTPEPRPVRRNGWHIAGSRAA